MTPDPASLAAPLARRLRRLYSRSQVRAASSPDRATGGDSVNLARYRTDPVGYARDVLRVTLTADQEQILRALPGRVKINSGHSVGKTFLAAVIANWWFDTRDPGVVITTAPTERDVVDLLWTEIRLQRRRAGLPMYFVGPSAPEMRTSEDHWAKGYTARKGESFQGRHRPSMLFIFDECEGVEPVYWDTTSTMYKPGSEEDHCWVAIGNPLTTTSRSYLEDLAVDPDGNPKWNLYTLSCLNHPNVLAELRGERPPIPDAVGLGQVNQWVTDWAVQVHPGEAKPTDFQWPPESGRWFRPGPNFQGRVLGVRPTGGVDNVWSLGDFQKCLETRWDPQHCWDMQFGITIGVDSSGFGDDDTCIHVRCGPVALHHESRNGWEHSRVAGRVKELCSQWSEWYNRMATYGRPPLSPLDVDVVFEFDGGYGVAVWGHRGEFENWRGVNVGGGSDALDPNGRPMYANYRAELWFSSAGLARGGLIDLSRLPKDAIAKLRLQLTTPFYENRPDGTRLVEPKKKVKERMNGKSPDDADALIISHARPADRGPTVLWKGGQPD